MASSQTTSVRLAYRPASLRGAHRGPIFTFVHLAPRSTVVPWLGVAGFLAIGGCAAAGRAEDSLQSRSASRSAAGSLSATPERPLTTGVTRTTTFGTPSGNINCALSRTFVRCDIRERTWQPPPKPADCVLDWGTAVGLSTAGSRFLCVGDAIALAKRRLAYGSALQAGTLKCTSRRSGLRCEDLHSRHGFTMGRASYRLF